MGPSLQGELKAQVAEAAARDPNTNVSSSDAMQVIMDESKKAGAVTMKFDPDASPEEKAAQAHAELDSTHKKPPKGVGVVTDINDGPDQYKLPPPTTAGAIHPSEDDKKDANGGPPEEDWDKFGWAPRYGTGLTKDADEDNRTLLDHQTFLESKLDEKFFGDWYHNTAIIIFACIFSWLIAALGGGIGWVLIVMTFCGTYYRTSIRRVRRNFRDDITREMAKTRLETDYETMEWMNSFLVKFWPVYAPQLAKGITQSVDQVLSASTPAFLESLKLDFFTLGTKPPRVEHVKTYPRAEDDLIIMDWKFSFTPNDTMDMTARQLKNKINPKVVLAIRIGKAMVSKALNVVVEDFAFSGLMRIKMKLQFDFPFIERADISFLGRPDIDYVCKPLGGDTLGFDINFIPGLESFIKEQIHGTLGPMMYDPNVFPIEIAKMLSGNPVDLAIGVVAVTIYGAQGLKNPDKFAGTPDPYTIVSLNSAKELARTKTVRENANPNWNETVYVIISNLTDALTLQVFDYNDVRKDKDLGTATFALDKLQQAHEHENMQLEVLASGKPRGVINTDIRYFPVLQPQKDPEGKLQPPPESNTGIARVVIEQAKDLDGTKSMVGQLSPYAVLVFNGKEVHKTAKLKRTNNPVWSEANQVLVTDRKKARIGLVIKDDRDMATDATVGTYQIKLEDLLKLQSQGVEWFNLHGTKTGRIKFKVEWRPVALSGVVGGSGYLTPIGVMRVHVQGATNLRNYETLGKSDPYARVLLSGIPKGRTVTFQNELNPIWDEVIYIPMHTTRERLLLEVMDEEKLGKDRTLGFVEILASDYIKESEEGGYEIHDAKTPLSQGLRLTTGGEEKGKINYTVSFYPTLNVIDPEEEEEERKAEAELAAKSTDASATPDSPANSKKTSLDVRRSVEEGRASTESTPGHKPTASVGALSTAETTTSVKTVPKIRINVEDLPKYESGLLVFNIIEGSFSQSDFYLEVLMDDQLFPSYISSKVRSRKHQFGDTGDAFVRELDMSRITLRLNEKNDQNGSKKEEGIFAKLTGQTLLTLQQCLYKPTELTLRSSDGSQSKVVVKLRYLPVKMTLDPSESINNMGTLRVDVLDAADLPSADRNGYSDPFCRFKLNGKEIYKTKVQKKTLHPAWNEFFEVPVSSRTGADFMCNVYDWDFGDKADFLGATPIDLKVLEPFAPKEISYPLNGKSGAIRLKMLFKPDYITRARQGTSTFSGTFAPAGKVVGAPVKGVTMVGGAVGGGVHKGASFLKRGFTHRTSSKDEAMVANGPGPVINGDAEPPSTPDHTPSRSTTVVTDTPGTPTTPIHSRTKSAASTTTTPNKSGETGTANFTIVSANGYPPSADVRVQVKMLSGKSAKDVFKTKAVKPSSGVVKYDSSNETFKVSCSADTQFQIAVKDHEMLRSKDLGEGLFFVSDQGSGAEQTVRAGSGSVTIRSSFTPNPSTLAEVKPSSSGRDSPDSKRDGGHRRSFFGKRDASGKYEAQ